MSLTREPFIDPITKNRVYYYIVMSSPAFGNTFITFVGHFSRPLEFSEDASSPYSKTYSFGFNVEASIPSLDDLYSEVSSNLSTMFLNPLG